MGKKKTSIIKASELESRAEMRAKLPKDLVDTFVAVKKDEFKNIKLYSKLSKLINNYLGPSKAEDKIEYSKILVSLVRATLDLFDAPAPKQTVKKITSCDVHKTYGGLRKPRTDCKTCWALYGAKNVKEKTKKQTKKS